MTLSNQNTYTLLAGIPAAIELMKGAALKLYSDVIAYQVPDIDGYTFGDYIEDLSKRASDGDQVAAETLGALIASAEEMEQFISEDMRRIC